MELFTLYLLPFTITIIIIIIIILLIEPSGRFLPSKYSSYIPKCSSPAFIPSPSFLSLGWSLPSHSPHPFPTSTGQLPLRRGADGVEPLYIYLSVHTHTDTLATGGQFRVPSFPSYSSSSSSLSLSLTPPSSCPFENQLAGINGRSNGVCESLSAIRRDKWKYRTHFSPPAPPPPLLLLLLRLAFGPPRSHDIWPSGTKTEDRVSRPSPCQSICSPHVQVIDVYIYGVRKSEVPLAATHAHTPLLLFLFPPPPPTPPYNRLLGVLETAPNVSDNRGGNGVLVNV